MKLIKDTPKTQAQANCIKRAYQLSKIKWYPTQFMPSNICWHDTKAFVYGKAFHMPFGYREGMAYSSCRETEKFVPYNISIETFMTALQNPHSVLYTKNLHGVGAGSISSYYGTVCSTFVSHVTGRPYRTICKAWPDLAEEIDASETLDVLQLCDIVDDPKKHIAIITGIWRDEEGHVQRVEISESVLPTAVTKVYTPEQIRGYWMARGFRFFRYKLPEDLSYTPSPYVPLEGEEEFPDVPEYAVMTNWGHNVNVLKGYEPVELSVIRGTWDTFLVTAPDGSTKTYAAGQQVRVEPPMVGDYTAVAQKGDARSIPVAWHVTDLKVTANLAQKEGQPVEVSFENAEEDTVFHCIVNVCPTNSIVAQHYLTEQESKDGRFTMPALPVGRYWCMVIAKNKFGCYASNHLYFNVVE